MSSFISGLRNSFKSKSGRPKSPGSSSSSSMQTNSTLFTDSPIPHRIVTTIETSDITYLSNSMKPSSPTSPTPNRHSITKKRSSSTRRLPFAIISNNTSDQHETFNASYNYEQNLLSPNVSPSIKFNNEANSGEEIDININNIDGNNPGMDEDWNETKNNINYAKQGFAFVRSTKSNSFRQRPSFKRR